MNKARLSREQGVMITRLSREQGVMITRLSREQGVMITRLSREQGVMITRLPCEQGDMITRLSLFISAPLHLPKLTALLGIYPYSFTRVNFTKQVSDYVPMLA